MSSSFFSKSSALSPGQRTFRAWLLALLWSGLPSTLHAFFTDGDLLGATRAAGQMIVAADAPESLVLTVAFIVHGAVSLFWTLLLRRFLPHAHVWLWAALAGIAIAVLDLLLIGSLFPSIRTLAFAPQLADHVAFSLLALSVPRPERPALA